MSLRDSELSASIAVSDAERAAEFYEGKLGLSPSRIQADGSRVYGSGGGASLHVYASPAHAGAATATLATWYVDDIEQVVDELTGRGVTFERYDEPELSTDEKGIARTGDGRVAWFKDPDGNTFAIEGERPGIRGRGPQPLDRGSRRMSQFGTPSTGPSSATSKPNRS